MDVTTLIETTPRKLFIFWVISTNLRNDFVKTNVRFRMPKRGQSFSFLHSKIFVFLSFSSAWRQFKMEKCPYAFQPLPHGLPWLFMSSNTISSIQAILVGFPIEFLQAKLLFAAESIPSSLVSLRTWYTYLSRKQKSRLQTKQVADAVPNQKSTSQWKLCEI